MKHRTDTPLYSRRTALQTLATGVSTVLAGCSSHGRTTERQSSTPTGKTTAQGDTLRTVRVEGTKLRVTLTDEADVALVTVVGPSGKTFESTDVSAGARRLSFDLDQAYTPGEYRVVATGEADILDERLVTLEPNVEIVDVGVARNHPDLNWEATGRWDLHVFTTVANTGSAPEWVTNLVFEGTPQPTAGAYGSESLRVGDDVVDDFVLVPESEVTLYSVMAPFAPVSGTCQDTTMTAIVRTSVTADETAAYDVTMSGDSLVDDCAISIQRGT